MFANQKLLGSYQSGQMGQTVNLLAMPSVVRIHHYPLFPKITQRYKDPVFIMRIGFFVFISPQNFSRKKQNNIIQEKAMDLCNPSLFIFLYQKISLSNSPDTSRRASSHHPQSQPCESSRDYEAYLLR